MGKIMNTFYEIKAKQEETAELLLYGDIGDSLFDEGVGAKQFAEDLKAFGKVKNLDIRINSGGGSVFDGLAIFNTLDRHQSKKTVYIDGIAASVASVVAMVGEKIVIAENAVMMVHNPFGTVIGDAADMRKMAETLDKVKEGMVSNYKRKAKLSKEEIASMMEKETWMSAKEAIKLGFATEVGKPVRVSASYDLSKYKNVPKDISNLLVQTSDGPEADKLKLERQEELFAEVDFIYLQSQK